MLDREGVVGYDDTLDQQPKNFLLGFIIRGCQGVLDALAKRLQRYLCGRLGGLVCQAVPQRLKLQVQRILALDQFIQGQRTRLVGVQQPLPLLLEQVLPTGVAGGDGGRCLQSGPGIVNTLWFPQQVR